MDAMQGVFFQLFWLAALVLTGQLFMRRLLKSRGTGRVRRMKLYMNLVAMNLKSQMQYRVSFLLTTLGQFITAFTSFFGLYFIFTRVMLLMI